MQVVKHKYTMLIICSHLFRLPGKPEFSFACSDHNWLDAPREFVFKERFCLIEWQKKRISRSYKINILKKLENLQITKLLHTIFQRPSVRMQLQYQLLALSCILLSWIAASPVLGDCPCPLVQHGKPNCSASPNSGPYRRHDDPGHRGLTGDCLPDVEEK